MAVAISSSTNQGDLGWCLPMDSGTPLHEQSSNIWEVFPYMGSLPMHGKSSCLVLARVKLCSNGMMQDRHTRSLAPATLQASELSLRQSVACGWRARFSAWTVWSSKQSGSSRTGASRRRPLCQAARLRALLAHHSWSVRQPGWSARAPQLASSLCWWASCVAWSSEA